MASNPTDSSVTQQLELDAICLRFEQAWQRNERPSIESFVERLDESQRSLLLPQLLLLELEYLEREREPFSFDEYISRFPSEPSLVRRAFDEHARAVAESDSRVAADRPGGTVDHDPIAEQPGSQIDRYKLLEQIGEGGMGVVYMAEQQRPVRRKVALKIIKPGMDTKQVIARFEAERQALAIMDHPNIARVLDAGSTESGRPYFVMELVRGIPITEYCDQNKLPTGERLELFVVVCQAVQHAHQKGIIHRDIKPTNVLVTLHDGVPIPKIIDFGVAKATNQQLTERTLFTAFTQMIGTPLYMSPEQAEMSGLDIDTRSDIYSLGVLLYELLTGATPFDEKRISTAAYDEVRRIIREEVPDKPSTRISSLGEHTLVVCAQRKTDAVKLRQLLSGELDWIVMTALEKDRTRRYQTARGLAADVSRYLAGEPVLACPPTLRYRFSKLIQRYKAQAAVASLFLLLLVASSVVAWVLFVNASQARNAALAATTEAIQARNSAQAAKDEIQTQKNLAEKNFQEAEQQRQQAGSLAAELQRRLYDYNLIKAAAAYRENAISHTSRLLADCLEPQRGWEWQRLERLTSGERKLDVSEANIVWFDVSSVASQIAVVDSAGNLRLSDVDNGQAIWSGRTDVKAPCLAWFSPTGETIAVVSYPGSRPGRLEIWDAATGERRWETTRDKEALGWAAFSPDGRQLVFSSLGQQAGSVELYDLKNLEPIWKRPCQGLALMTFSGDAKHLYMTLSGSSSITSTSTLCCWSVDEPGEIWSVSLASMSLPCLTPDGRQLVTGGSSHSLQIRDPASGKMIEEFPSRHPDVAFYMAFSTDGRYVSSVGHQGNVVIWDWHNKNELQSMDVPSMTTAPPVFTPDGDQFVLASTLGSAAEFRNVRPLPAEVVLEGHEKTVKGLAYSPDGKRIFSASYDGTIRTWSTATGQELHARAAHGEALALAFSPQGTHVASGGRDGAKLWVAETGELVHHWPQAGSVWWLDFSPAGDRLITGGGQDVIKLFDVGSGQEALSCDVAGGIDGIVFDADGRRAVSMNTTGQLDIWDLETGAAQPLRAATDNDLARCLVRHPNANQVAAGINDTIELWDVDRRQLVSTLRGHNDLVNCLAFNRDGSRLFSGDAGGLIKVWNLDTNEQLFMMQSHIHPEDPGGRLGGVQSLALSPDGTTLASGGIDRLVKLWETTRPTRALADRRRIVQQATQVVNERYQQSGSLRTVLESLTQDGSLNQQVLATAVEIANARGDRPRAAAPEADPIETQMAEIRQDLKNGREAFVELIEAASGDHFDTDDVDSALDESRWWFWVAVLDIIPTFTFTELEHLLEPLVEEYPDAHQFLLLRGLAHGMQERWREAEVDLSAALECVPEKTGLWHSYAYPLAFLYVHQGDLVRYHDLCEKALRDFRDTADSAMAEQIAKMCFFSPHVGTHVDEATRLAHRAMEGTPNDNFRWFSLAAGMAQYRRGNWPLAIEMLRQAQAPVGSQRPKRMAASFLFQALAYEKLGQHGLAKESLAAAEGIMNAPGYSEGGMSWWDLLAVQTIHDEAQQLLQGEDTDAALPSEREAHVAARLTTQRIVPPNSVWKWLHPTDGVDPATHDADFHSTFFDPAYDDTHWSEGQDSPGAEAGFGYGDPAGIEFEIPAKEHRKTAYFRHRFTTDRAYDEFLVSMQRDDGVIVYLDGVEVVRNNVGDGTEAYDLSAPNMVGGGQETWVGFYQLPGSLESGEHVLAISVHNNAAGHADLRIAEISLWGAPRKQAAAN